MLEETHEHQDRAGIVSADLQDSIFQAGELFPQNTKGRDASSCFWMQSLQKSFLLAHMSNRLSYFFWYIFHLTKR